MQMGPERGRRDPGVGNNILVLMLGTVILGTALKGVVEYCLRVKKLKYTKWFALFRKES